jgi:7,8-dihydroneopterin aldolase/epimerase/oxygenase
MGIISLEGLEFFSYHGFYAEEQKIGNRYSVDVNIEVDFAQAAIGDKLSETVNYENVYKVVAQVMAQKHKLLEHIAYNIIQQIKQQYPRILAVEVSVSKFNPPIGGVCERAKITIKG